MNEVGKTIEVNPILSKHSKEIGCGTCAKICEYLKCNKGEVYVAFNDVDNIQQGVLCRIKEDICLSRSLAAFSAKDDDEQRHGEYWHNVGYDGNTIVFLDHFKYIMRLN